MLWHEHSIRSPSSNTPVSRSMPSSSQRVQLGVTASDTSHQNHRREWGVFPIKPAHTARNGCTDEQNKFTITPTKSLSFFVFSVLKRTPAWENCFYFHCAFLVAFYELEIHLFKNQFSWQAKKNIWLLVTSFQLRIIGADMLPRNSSGWTFFAARSLRPGAEARSVSDRRGRKQR